MDERLLKLEDRLLKLLDTEQLSSSKFADVIGVQRSSVSHILTGRNKPSFDFLQKTLKAFPMLNADWLILSEGEMYEGERGPGGGSLFDQPSVAREGKTSERDVGSDDDNPASPGHRDENSPSGAVQRQDQQQAQKKVQQQAQHQVQQQTNQQSQQQAQQEQTIQQAQQHTNQQAQHQVPDQGNKGPGAVKEWGSNDPEASTDTSRTSTPVTPHPGATGRDRKVSRVILFYDDNSFETFEPA